MEAQASLAGLKKVAIEKEEVALKEFEDFMRPRIESARRGEFVDQSVEEIFDEVLQEDE